MNAELLAWLASCNKDPYAFVMGAFPWGEADTTLEEFSGPDEWQQDILCAIRDGLLSVSEAIRIAVASGHGIGKSSLVSWIILWAFFTSPDCRGVVTANTESQLRTKTWAELGKWFNLCFFARDHFKLTATALLSRDPSRERTWRIDMIAWSKDNPEAFAGMHNKGKRLLLVMDEASAIEDIIWEVAEGALTDSDTEIIWLAFGNPTRNSGRFKECFAGGRFAHMWNTRQIDSRSVKITNKKLFADWEKAYGEDSDFFRIRVKGQFPRHGELEFFSAADVDEAMTREVSENRLAPLALGVDVARFGSNESIIYPRKGRDARTIPFERYTGLSTVELAARTVETSNRLHADGIFVDGGGVGGGVVDQIRNLQLHCFEVQFGGKDIRPTEDWGNSGEKYANNRATMYGSLRAWLKTGAIPNDADLRAQLLSITYTLNVKDEIILTSKEQMMRDGKPSPDIVDGLATTFAYPLQPHREAGGLHAQHAGPPQAVYEYDPFSAERLAS